MTITHPWVCLVALAPIVWVIYSWRLTPRRLNLALKGAAFAAIAFALAEPVMKLPGMKTGVVVLVDTSGSITSDDLARADSLVAEIARHKGRNWLRVVPFASRTRPLKPEEASGPHFVRTTNQTGTNLETALIDSMAAIPAGHLPRLLLVSDGNDNEGSTARALAELRQLDVPVDTIALAGTSATGLRLETISMPPNAYAGEQIPIDLTIDSPVAQRATVQIYADAKDLGASPVELSAGSNSVRVQAHVRSTGVVPLSGHIRGADGAELQFNQAIELRRAKVLYVSQDPDGMEGNLLEAFNQAEFEVARDARELQKPLDSYQLVVLNNVDLNTFTAAEKSGLEEYVKAGGGLLLIGGERQAYKDDRQMDALDRALPAKIAPPRTQEGTCVALIIDKSSSMEGRKIELARLSAVGVVDHLRPTDTIGVLIFDNSFQWAVPMRRAEDKSMIKRLIAGITPDGGTQIAPALTEAYRKVLPSQATYKHIVLLTDGISEEGDSMDLAKEAADHSVTISTVGLGQDVNRSYLEKVAEASGGRSYFLNEPQGLEQILLKDVQDYSGATAVERDLRPIVEQKAEVLKDTNIETAPPLRGYVRFTPKPDAETILGIDEQRKDPLYIRWQYGLGRAAVFASDAKSRWAQDWVSWPGFDKFWINLSRDLLSHAKPTEAHVEFDAANSELVVTYRLANTTPEPPSLPPVFILGPRGFRKPVAVQKIAARYYEGRTRIGETCGLFRIRPLQESNAFPEIGFYREPPETHDYGSNEALLKQISNFTGGRFNPSPASVFDAGGRTINTAWQLWPGLLGLAIALTLGELLARKSSSLTQLFRRVTVRG
ncbi:MAG: VWA domain-containing protein [Acidobacteriaceae bacterium]|nr:VWA domain-containing protein [Acidobacteriaceae bacterium]